MENVFENKIIKELFENTLAAMKYLGFKNSEKLFINYSSIIQKIKCAEEERPESNTTSNFDTFLLSSADSIISSKIKNGRVEISLLSNLPAEWQSGSLTKVCLKGNILADIKWRDGKFEDARLYTEQGTVFMKELTICYGGKKYSSQLSDGSLDIRNVLPTTV